MTLQLKSIFKEVDAVKVFSIHMPNADLFDKFTRDPTGEVVLPEKRKERKVYPVEINRHAISLEGMWSAFI